MHIGPIQMAPLVCDGPHPFSPLLVLGVREERGAGAHALAPHRWLKALRGVTLPRQHHTNLGRHGRSGKRLSAFTTVTVCAFPGKVRRNGEGG